MCDKECIPWTDIKANQREIEYDDFCKDLVARTPRGTDSNLRFEIAWQLKRCADSLEKLTNDITSWPE
jgi:hypothetical protein